jgi:hypothetical protein
MAIGQRKGQDLGLGTPANENLAIMVEIAHRRIPADNLWLLSSYRGHGQLLGYADANSRPATDRANHRACHIVSVDHNIRIPMLARTREFGISEGSAMPLMHECKNALSLLSAALVFRSFACLI